MKECAATRASSILEFTVSHRTAMFVPHIFNGNEEEIETSALSILFSSSLCLMSHSFQTIQFGIESVGTLISGHHDDRHLFLFVSCLTFRSDIFVVSRMHVDGCHRESK